MTRASDILIDNVFHPALGGVATLDVPACSEENMFTYDLTGNVT